MSEDSINLREEDAENLDGPVEVGSGKLHEEELSID